MQRPKNDRTLLAKVVVDNASAAERGVRVVARGEGDTAEADLYVYDVIDAYWGVSARTFIDSLASVTAKRVNLRINSPGGDVFEARAMVTALRAFREQGHEVVAYIDGIAASAASYLALAADRVVMADGAFYMIHKAWAMTLGNADDMTAMGAILSKVDESIVDDYARKTNKSRDELIAWMSAETWFTAAEARDAGFVDEVTGEPEAAAKARTWKLEGYANAPKLLAEPPQPTAEDAGLRALAGRMLAWVGATADKSEPSRAEQAFAARRAAAMRVIQLERAHELEPVAGSRTAIPSA
jgi:ATP-dependent Clp protease, protease subunit